MYYISIHALTLLSISSFYIVYFFIVSINTSHFQIPRKAIFMDNVACVGQEDILTDCTRITYTFDEAKQYAQNFLNVASVSCMIPKPSFSSSSILMLLLIMLIM